MAEDAKDAVAELFTFKCPRELSQRVRQIEARDGETRSTVLRRLIRAGLARDDRRRELEAATQ
jgi:hypothetical protein